MARRLRRRAEPTSTDRIFAGAGAHGIYDDSALQTRYRDVNTACHHAAVDFDGNAEMYGRTRLGLGPARPSCNPRVVARGWMATAQLTVDRPFAHRPSSRVPAARQNARS